VLLAMVLRLHIKDFFAPYVLLVITGGFAALILFIAVRYAKQPKQYSILLSLTVLLVFLSWTLVCSHFGVKLAIFTREFATIFMICGFVGAAFSSIHVYNLTHRHRSAQVSNQTH
jgi:hypothetical protein